MKNAKAFANFLIARKGLQQITVDGYVSTYKRFSKLIGDDPTILKAEKFIYDFYISDYSYSYKLNTVLALESYMEFIGKPTKFGRRKKPKPIIKNTLTEAEVTKMIFNCRNSREKAIIALLAYSGIRNLELCMLKVEDFLFANNAIRVIRGKGIKDGMSEIAPECTEILMQYLHEYPREKHEFMFTTLQKKHRMATNDIRKWVKVIAKRSKIEKRIYPHLFRHSMTANMILRGADLISLKNQLRHSWLETTLHYANSIVFVEKNRYQKFAPSYI